MRRKEQLVTGEIYHVFNRSIADFKIFNNDQEFLRMRDVIKYYQSEERFIKFSKFIKLQAIKGNATDNYFSKDEEKSVQIITYCVMPTHLHLVLKQLTEGGISIFMSKILNSYSKYFNIKHKRKGPLWENRFANVLVKSDEQLLHLTRYIHLNPVTAYLIEKPEYWLASSYQEYISKIDLNDRICKYDDILEINPISYRQFVEDRISSQRELAKIKELILERENFT